MVPGGQAMKQLRNTIPFLAVFALAALFFSLPETPDLLAKIRCKPCSSNGPYLPLIGSGYFAALGALSLLFPAFPGRHLALTGLIWAMLLAAVLTYIHFPLWCAACLLAHACNIAIWSIWVAIPSQKGQLPSSTFRERLCLTLFVPLCIISLFSSLNLTFRTYNSKIDPPVSATELEPGNDLPAFSTQTSNGRLFTNTDTPSTKVGSVINFISPECSHCKEQLAILDPIAKELAGESYRFINVTRIMAPELAQRSPFYEWVEDKGGTLHALFKVSRYPTLFIVGANGKVAQVIPGVPDQLKEQLLTGLLKIKKTTPRPVSNLGQGPLRSPAIQRSQT
jgi:thiol-disulfide isomerase/thioredoxin